MNNSKLFGLSIVLVISQLGQSLHFALQPRSISVEAGMGRPSMQQVLDTKQVEAYGFDPKSIGRGDIIGAYADADRLFPEQNKPLTASKVSGDLASIGVTQNTEQAHQDGGDGPNGRPKEISLPVIVDLIVADHVVSSDKTDSLKTLQSELQSELGPDAQNVGEQIRVVDEIIVMPQSVFAESKVLKRDTNNDNEYVYLREETNGNITQYIVYIFNQQAYIAKFGDNKSFAAQLVGLIATDKVNDFRVQLGQTEANLLLESFVEGLDPAELNEQPIVSISRNSTIPSGEVIALMTYGRFIYFDIDAKQVIIITDAGVEFKFSYNAYAQYCTSMGENSITPPQIMVARIIDSQSEEAMYKILTKLGFSTSPQLANPQVWDGYGNDSWYLAHSGIGARIEGSQVLTSLEGIVFPPRAQLEIPIRADNSQPFDPTIHPINDNIIILDQDIATGVISGLFEPDMARKIITCMESDKCDELNEYRVGDDQWDLGEGSWKYEGLHYIPGIDTSYIAFENVPGRYNIFDLCFERIPNGDTILAIHKKFR